MRLVDGKCSIQIMHVSHTFEIRSFEFSLHGVNQIIIIIMHILKLRIIFCSADFLRTQAGISLRYLWEIASKRSGKSQYTERFMQHKLGRGNVKKLLLFIENQMSQINGFSTFLCMRGCQSLSSLKSFLWYVS